MAAGKPSRRIRLEAPRNGRRLLAEAGYRLECRPCHRTSQRVGRFTESVIRRMTRVAKECGAVNLSQGFPDFDPPPELPAALEKAAPRRPAPVRRHLGRGEFPPGARPQAEPVHGACHRSRREHRRDLWQHRGDDGRDDDRLQPGRQGDRVLALLRELRGRHDPVRGGADLRAAAAAGFRVRPRRTAPRVRAAPQGADPLQSLQPHRQSVHPRRTAADRRAWPRSSTRSSSPTKSTSTSCMPRTGTRTSRPCPACSTARSRAVRFRRPTRSPAGGWAM